MRYLILQNHNRNSENIKNCENFKRLSVKSTQKLCKLPTQIIVGNDYNDTVKGDIDVVVRCSR